jgi:hypothetical protein
MSATRKEVIAVENVNHPRSVKPVDAEMYQAMKRGFLKILPRYMVYARPWFFDHANHVNRRRIPVDMPLERYDELPDSVRPIVARAPYYRMLARWDEADAPASAAERPPEVP